MAELSIASEAGQVRAASAWLESSAASFAVPPEQTMRLSICLNEILANILSHGGPGALAVPVALRLEVSREEELCKAVLGIRDGGHPFDPTRHVPRPRPNSLAEAEPGGLGLVMIRDNADALHYRRADDSNQLDIVVSWPLPPDLAWIPLFHKVDSKALRAALAGCEMLTLPAGTVLLEPGKSNNSVFILLGGEMAAYLDGGRDPRSAICIGVGECMGELSALDGKQVSARVEAKRDSRVLVLPHEVFWNRLLVLPGVASNLMVALAERMRNANLQSLQLLREQLELQHIKKELAVARQLQTAMVPPLLQALFPDCGVEVCGFMEPAAEVGGDFFDAFPIDDDTLFICIGDVSGHGIAAALFMARVISVLRTMAPQHNGKPAALLEAVNARLCEGNEANIFVTLFCAFLDSNTGRLHYSNAGHCPPLLVNGTHCRELQLPKGALMGAMPGLVYSAMSHALAPGELLLCYTDGMTEAVNAQGMEFGDAGLHTAVLGCVSQELPTMLTALRKAVDDFLLSGQPQDDCTLLALRRPGETH